MENLFLHDNLLIARGGERACYIHPKDSTKVVKIVFANEGHNRQNELEYTYYCYLARKQIAYTHITKCYGYIATNYGLGLVFERVLNHDDSPCRSLRYAMAYHLINEKLQHELLEELRIYLNTQNILFVDTSLTNIFLQEYTPNQFRLIIVDGLGAKRVGLKSWLYRHSHFYLRYKITRQWTKCMKDYHADLRRIQEGKRPITRF